MRGESITNRIHPATAVLLFLFFLAFFLAGGGRAYGTNPAGDDASFTFTATGGLDLRPYPPVTTVYPTDPSAAPLRDERYWPAGYFPGDPLPPRTIYLTFDDGPCDFTGELLDILKKEGVRATFFLNAFDKASPVKDDHVNYMLRYADVLRRMVADGHALGNHTYSHRNLATLTPAEIDYQLSKLHRDLVEVLGDRTPTLHLIRPPFGSPWLGTWNKPSQQKRVCTALRDRGFVMLWTTGWDSGDSVDWARGEWFTVSARRYHPGGTAYEQKMEREEDRILARADGLNGGVILMHDTHPTSRDVLKALIRELKRRGYSFGTLEDYCRWRWGVHVFDRLDAAAAGAVPSTVPTSSGAR